MKLVAHLDFSLEQIEEMLAENVAREGYILCDDVTWNEEGGAQVRVRPMTDEEKVAEGLETREPAQILADDLKDTLKEMREESKNSVEALFRLVDRLPDRVGDVFDEKIPDKGSFSSNSGEIVGVSPADYGLDHDASEDEIVARQRVERIREEQGNSRELYGDDVKDEDGFVVLKSPDDA